MILKNNNAEIYVGNILSTTQTKRPLNLWDVALLSYYVFGI